VHDYVCLILGTWDKFAELSLRTTVIKLSKLSTDSLRLSTQNISLKKS